MPTASRPRTPKATSGSPATRPSADANRVRAVSQADVAKARRCARSTVSRACLPGGPLHAALLPGGARLDAAHPACRAWIGQPAGPYVYGFTLSDARELGMLEPEPVTVLDPERFVTFEQLAAMSGIPLDELQRNRRLFKGAIVESPVDLDHPAAQAFLAEPGTP